MMNQQPAIIQATGLDLRWNVTYDISQSTSERGKVCRGLSKSPFGLLNGKACFEDFSFLNEWPLTAFFLPRFIVWHTIQAAEKETKAGGKRKMQKNRKRENRPETK